LHTEVAAVVQVVVTVIDLEVAAVVQVVLEVHQVR
jgi:hypothetical protein